MTKAEIALELTKLISNDIIREESRRYLPENEHREYAKVLSNAYNEIFATINLSK